MAIIRLHSSPGKQKRKPGWQKEKAEHDAWLDRLKSQTTGFARSSITPKQHKQSALSSSQDTLKVRPESRYVKGSGTKRVERPDILYKDDPEMLARELAARSRKFAVAPMYNKGGAMLVTDEAMKDITAGATRRR